MKLSGGKTVFMFKEITTHTEGQRGLLLFGLQQTLVPLGAIVLGLILLVPVVPRGDERSLVGIWSLLYAYPALTGFLFAGLVNLKWRNAYRTGRWIWIVPTLIWACDLLFVGSDTPFSARLSSEFAPAGSTEGLQLALVTIPTLTCICYSVALTVAAHRRERMPP